MSVASAAGVTALLEELADKLMCFGNHALDAIAAEFWADFSAAMRTVTFAHRDKTLAKRTVAALFASRVYLQLDRPSECLRYALAAGDLFAGAACDAYAAAIVARCVDGYAAGRDGGGGGHGHGHDDQLHRRRSSTAFACSSPSTSSAATARDDGHLLECVLDRVFARCLDDRDHRLLLGLGLRARRMDVVVGCVRSAADGDNRTKMLPYATWAAMNHVDHGGFRDAVLRGLVRLHDGRDGTADLVSVSQLHAFLDDADSAARLLRRLVLDDDDGGDGGGGGTEDHLSAVFRIAFDLYELATQRFLARVIAALEPGADESRPRSVRCRRVVLNLIAVLNGAMSVEQNSRFLIANNRSDVSVLYETKKAVHTSISHTAVVIANGFVHSGTTSDGFLREYLEFANLTTWDLFSAVVSLGVIHRGHETNALQLIYRYLYLLRMNSSARLGYSEAGGLYALGLIFANHGAAINDYLLYRLKNEPNEIIKHGCCLGIGLSGMGTRSTDIYEQLKTIMYQDSAVFGEAVGLAIGLVMLGSKNDEILQDMVTYAHSTQHEHTLRGLAVGMSFFMYGQLEKADVLISSLLQEKNPILRCSAMYTISMAYCGTGSKTAIKKLLHTANSDVDDEVRCAAVTSLGFLLFRTPEQCLQIINVLTKSYNHYVRYGAAMALGIACAGTGRKEAIDLLEPLFYDLVNYVRQGALIASALICIQQTESTCRKIKYFRSLYTKVITDNYEDDVVKFGAILAQGIIDSGGRNVSISLDSRTGYLNTLTVVGLLLFTQYQFCICLAHCLTLAFTPICTIGFNTKLNIPTYELKNSNQIIHEVCFNALCQELAEKRGWIQCFFNQSLKPKHNKLKKRPLPLEMFAYRFLIPKIVRDIEVLKDNWPTSHFFLQRITCHSEYFNGVNCVQYDTVKIVSGLCDCTIKIWNKCTLECVKVMIGHTGPVMCLQFDEKMIISGSVDTTIRVWNIFTGKMVCLLTHHCAAVLHLRFSDNMMATCSKDSSIIIWNILSPSDIALHCILVGHQAEVNVVYFDSKYIVSGSKDCVIKVWNTFSCDFVRDLIGHYHGITCLQYKDRLVVSGSSDNTIRLWDIEYGACLRVLENCEELVSCIKFNSKIIVSGAFDGKIKVWDLEAALDPSVLESCLCLRTLEVHKDIVYDLQFDESQIISCSKDGTILLWDFLNYDKTSNKIDSSNNSSSCNVSEIRAGNTSSSFYN